MKTAREILLELWALGNLGETVNKSLNQSRKVDVDQALKDLDALVPKKRKITVKTIAISWENGRNEVIDEMHKIYHNV